MQPLTNSLWSRAITLRNDITMSGGGTIDSFDSSSPFKSTGGLYDPAKRQSNGSIATLNSGSNSDLKSTYVYGGLTYSGSPVKNTTNVQGTIATPRSARPSPTRQIQHGTAERTPPIPAAVRRSPRSLPGAKLIPS